MRFSQISQPTFRLHAVFPVVTVQVFHLTLVVCLIPRFSPFGLKHDIESETNDHHGRDLFDRLAADFQTTRFELEITDVVDASMVDEHRRVASAVKARMDAVERAKRADFAERLTVHRLDLWSQGRQERPIKRLAVLCQISPSRLQLVKCRLTDKGSRQIDDV